jgi:flagella basal body P-ring formation protein FlgA
MPHRVLLSLCLVAGALQAQSRASVDSLVVRITAGWGHAPNGGWSVEWHPVRGDSTALRPLSAEFSAAGNGYYTITMRPAAFAAPTLVARLRIGAERDELVAARSLPRGATLQESDLLVRTTLAWGIPIASAPIAASDLIGTETRRSLRNREAIRTHDVTAAPVVMAGDSVRAELIRDGVRLALTGTALHNAALGGRVAIRLDRGRRFAGVATGRNTVRLD